MYAEMTNALAYGEDSFSARVDNLNGEQKKTLIKKINALGTLTASLRTEPGCELLTVTAKNEPLKEEK